MTSFTASAKLAKDMFRCFHCRLVFRQRDGDWINWDAMQVHLCRRCNQETQKRPERIAEPSET